MQWRKTRDPYKIFISELMLQQTQVDRVIPQYANFVKKFPTIRHCAFSPLQEILIAWKGLGYNRRAVYIKRTAEIITRDYKGKFPKDYKALRALPGIGDYTARAIQTFAWNTPNVFIETNIRRIFLYEFFPRIEKVADSSLLLCVQKTLPKKHMREWYWALMDYGAIAMKNIDNPNRRSLRYARQTKFEGSQRHARSFALAYVAKNKSATITQIKKQFLLFPKLSSYGGEKLVLILATLSRDGFLEKRKNAYRIAS